MPRAKLLIVDDNTQLLELFGLAFSTNDLEVVGCPSPQEALDLLTREEFAAVLTDFHMPGLTGEDFCRRAVALCPDTPVVVMTAEATGPAAVAALKAGARDFFPKPLHLESARLRILRLVEEHRTRVELRRLRATLAALERPA